MFLILGFVAFTFCLLAWSGLPYILLDRSKQCNCSYRVTTGIIVVCKHVESKTTIVTRGPSLFRGRRI